MRPVPPGSVVRRHRPRRTPPRWPGVVAILVALGAGGVVVAGSGVDLHHRPSSAWFAPLATTKQFGVGGPSTVVLDSPIPPTRVRIPAIGVDSALEPLHLDKSGQLIAPDTWNEAGWFADGTPPGAVGPAVIAGHVDSRTSPAVFYRLSQLRQGDLIEVARAGRWLSFRVIEVTRYAKDQFPTDQVYGPTVDPQLRLITCGGAFDQARDSYLDNTVVYAVLA